ncbi:MAG: GDSL-type esterase/lipase family protein, partial [Microcystaceae cyanobacterium]
LNASANSWGPRNQEAYLRRYGLFEAQIVVLLLNTDDLFATAPTSLPVGRDRNYPAYRPPLALIEIFSRFFGTPQPIQEMAEVRKEKGDRVGLNLAAIAKIQDMAKQANAQFLLAMSPLLREVEASPREYEQKARQRLQQFTGEQHIPYVDFLAKFKQFERPETLYRDHIHLTPQGNQFVSETLSHSILGMGNGEF